jgi:hypothetical protein
MSVAFLFRDFRKPGAQKSGDGVATVPALYFRVVPRRPEWIGVEKRSGILGAYSLQCQVIHIPS